ncbi:MAG: NAD(P)H-dependent oxidoreductase [Bacteriovorax sp.]|nr:NAD(P)H-dependent oxidoreductase [Bacteriovorax sp.]
MNKIIALAGSTRTESYNKKILKVGIYGAREAGAEVTVIDLRDYPMPLYDGDLEEKEGIPDNAKKLKEIFKLNHGLLLALPEYNSSFSGVFKNTIDWVSRQVAGESPLECFSGKVAALMSASPGGLGGIRGLVHARAMLENIEVIVMPEQICVGKVADILDDDGNLKDEKIKKSIEKLGVNLVDFTLRVKGFYSKE